MYFYSGVYSFFYTNESLLKMGALLGALFCFINVYICGKIKNIALKEGIIMAISKNDVEYVMKLARMDFTEKEKENLVSDLNKVLEYMEKLNELDTKHTDIIVNPYFIENKLREDKVQKSTDLEITLKNSPENLEEYIKVPKVIE